MDFPRVKDVLMALDAITGGRVVTQLDQLARASNRFVVIKSSGIPGKAVMETPGLVFGDPEQPVRKLAVTMTLTESQIELAGAMDIDAVVAHHPVADAANSGGVPLKFYLSLYGIAVFEVHEAFHGLHPGIPFLHGHRPLRVDIAYGGVPGNIMYVGEPLDGIRTAGDILHRLEDFMGFARERDALDSDRDLRECPDAMETVVATGPQLLNGSPSSPVRQILHIFPHTGFSDNHLSQALTEHPEVNTIVASISRVRSSSPLVEKARELGLTFLVGNSHAVEILENGMPLAYALRALLPAVEVWLFRERVLALPLERAGHAAVRQYAQDMAGRFLLPKQVAARPSGR
ncbi:MAG: Nif3-like dinuclear metal center hexameric protein [Bacillota bacterium]